jgi:hypothetical protein
MKGNRSQFIPDKIATVIIDQLICGEVEYKNENDRRGVAASIRVEIQRAFAEIEAQVLEIPSAEVEKYLETMIVKAQEYGGAIVSKLDELSEKRNGKSLNGDFIKRLYETITFEFASP